MNSILTDFNQKLELLAQQTDILKHLGRGVERETLRSSEEGALSSLPHPASLGSPLTNDLITTDFAESLLEFITPVNENTDELVAQLKDIHHFTQTKLGDEVLWPFSMPCFVGDEDDITLAQYGSSNSGRMRTLYREGLKRRYGSLMQIISGVHFNFSFPESFWDLYYGEQSQTDREATKSAGYFGLIRNYYRFGWLIPFFFGASPSICGSFLKGRKSSLPFEYAGKSLYLPYATSLRLSDLGYTNSAQSSLRIGFNSLDQYLEGVSRAIKTPSEDFSSLGVKVDGEYRQLNSNILQIENELYAPIRPKRVAKRGEKPSEALARGGVEYIEVRSLDVNPFSPIGVTQQQIHFLDLFLTWAMLSDSDPMDNCELECWRDNWRKVVIEGRKPGLALKIGCHGESLTLQEWAHRVFDDLDKIANLMDDAWGGDRYREVCRELRTWIDSPELTLSGQLLEKVKANQGTLTLGCELAKQHKQSNLQHQYAFYSEAHMESEVERSQQAQQNLEASDSVDFDSYLAEYFAYLQPASETV